MARIAIVSDIHLGTRQYGIAERYDDFIRAFERFGESVKEENVDAVVIGGDLFDSSRPDAHSVLRARDVIGGIPVDTWGIEGNHDLSGGDWLRVVGAHVLDEIIPVEIAGVRVVGISYRNGRDLVASIRRMADDGMKADVLVAHFALSEMNGGGSADTGVQELSPLLDEIGVKAVLMGHVHIPDCRRWNGVLYVNPGSTEMKSSNEPKDKYYFILDTETWEAVEIPIRTREVRPVEISSESALASFSDDLMREAEAVSDGSTTDRPFYQIIADDTVDDVFNRLSSVIHATSAIARIVMRASTARDLAPVIDRRDGVATLESTIKARFPEDTDEYRLTMDYLHSPDSASISLITKRFIDRKE